MAHSYPSVSAAKLAIEAVGNVILDEGIPERFAPMVFVFNGAGNVSQVALVISC